MPYSNPEDRKAWLREAWAKRRAEWIAEHGPCIDCGSHDQPEVDHVDRTTKVSHRVWTWSKERRDAELAKCVVRCRPCHLAKSFAVGDIQPPSPHGSKRRYDVHGCRCTDCRAGNTARRRKQRQPS